MSKFPEDLTEREKEDCQELCPKGMGSIRSRTRTFHVAGEVALVHSCRAAAAEPDVFVQQHKRQLQEKFPGLCSGGFCHHSPGF